MPRAKIHRRQVPLQSNDEQPKFYHANTGHLTMYAFQQGYVEEYENNIRMYLEGNFYHVRGRKPDGSLVKARFDTMSSARQFARLHGKYIPPEDAFSGI